jgi:hypothetical protein
MGTNLKKPANVGSDTPQPEAPQGREDLRFWHRELAGALTEEREGVALVSNLREAIQAGQRAEASAVAGLCAGHGAALPNAADLTEKIANGNLAAKALRTPKKSSTRHTASGALTRRGR